MAESADTGAPVRDCLQATARTTGRQVGEGVHVGPATTDGDDHRDRVIDVLEQQGYEPVIGAADEIALPTVRSTASPSSDASSSAA